MQVTPRGNVGGGGVKECFAPPTGRGRREMESRAAGSFSTEGGAAGLEEATGGQMEAAGEGGCSLEVSQLNFS